MKRREAPKRDLGTFIKSENPRTVTGVSAQTQLSVLSSPKAAPKTWVNSAKIQFMLKSLSTSVSALTLTEEVKSDLIKQLQNLTALVAPENKRHISLAKLYDQFWNLWRSFRRSLNSVLETDDAPPIFSFCCDRLKTIQGVIQKGEAKVPESLFSPERFEYVYGKMAIILPMFENVDTIDISAILHHLRSIHNILTKRTSSFFVNDGDFQFCMRNLKHVIESLHTISKNDAAKESVVTEFGNIQTALKKLIPPDLKTQKNAPKSATPRAAPSRGMNLTPEKRSERSKRTIPKYDMPEFEARPTLTRAVYPKKRAMTPPAGRVKSAAVRQAELRSRKLAAGERMTTMRDAFIPLARKQTKDSASVVTGKKRSPTSKLSPSNSSPHMGRVSKSQSSAFDPRLTSRRYRNEDTQSTKTTTPVVTKEVSPPQPQRRRTSTISSGSYNEMSDSHGSRRTASHVDHVAIDHEEIADDRDSVATCDFGTKPKGYHEQPEEDVFEYYYTD